MAETWVFNVELTLDSFQIGLTNFTYNGSNYNSIYREYRSGGFGVNTLEFGGTQVYDDSGWIVGDRTITFETSPTGDLLTWLQANAVKQEEPTTTQNIKIGASTPTKICIGDTEISKCYIGTDLVWEKSEPQPTGETWVVNESPTITTDTIGIAMNINFTSNNETFVRFDIPDVFPRLRGIYYKNDSYVDFGAQVYKSQDGSWIDQAYRTITFETSPTGALLTWLQENGIKQ